MRITVYSDTAGAGIGGAEYCAVVLASAFARQHQTRFVHHHPGLTRELIQEAFGEDASRVSLEYLQPDAAWLTPRWKESLNVDTDCLISICHWAPPVCTVDHGILYVLFPLFDRGSQWPWSEKRGIRNLVRRHRYNRLWRARLASYSTVISISDYTRRWTKRLWGCDSSIIYPAVDLAFPVEQKSNKIISVGRFCEMKKQKEMLRNYLQMPACEGWRFECCGNPAGNDYLVDLRALAANQPVDFLVGQSRDVVKQRLATARIFWHAAGYGIDEEKSPGELEHFGIVTAEAMAAGCVPVVIGKGGQREIVEHGVSGFLCNSFDEMRDASLLLMQNDDKMLEMSVAAQKRSAAFSKQRFISQFESAVLPTYVS